VTTDRSKKQKALADASKDFVILAHNYNVDKHVVDNTNIKSRQVHILDWLVYEKIDGVRAVYKGGVIYSRNKLPFSVPDQFLDLCKTKANLVLDGELVHPDGFQTTVSIVKDKTNKNTWDYWKNIQYKVFDCITKGDEDFEYRQDILKSNIKDNYNVSVLPSLGRVKDDSTIPKLLSKIEKRGGEGLMLRNPTGLYTTGRSWDLLKVKSFIDCEATVIKILPGEGKHANRMGKLVCKLANGVEFECGTGFTDEQRENPPSVGSVITIKYFDLTNEEKKPRFPSFISARDYE
jgi:DNA ligase-1